MNRRTIAKLLLLATITVSAIPAAAQNGTSTLSPAEARIAREVRHELLMLPYYNVFDYMAFEVHGYDVKLIGSVTRPVLKSDAQNVVKRIEGVQKVDNQIEVLPPSPTDDRLRLELYRTIYDFPALEKYALGTLKPIRIIVNMGRVTLEGVVDSEADKNLVTLRANGVPGIFAVTNHLQVVKS